jgi:hypothetical protein
VRTAYTECQVEVPLGMKDLGVAVRPEPGCALGVYDSLVVWLRPYTGLYSCQSGQFLDAEGLCVNCHETEQQSSGCALGDRLAGCPALEHRFECVECAEDAVQVAVGAAPWVQIYSSICAWECSQDFFSVDAGCARCSTQQEACPPGQRWQACS